MRLIDAPNRGQMAVRVVDHRARADRSGQEDGRIEILLVGFFQIGRNAIGRRGHRVAQRLQDRVPVAARRRGAAGDRVAITGVAQIAGRAARLDLAFVGERQAPLPGEIEAQHIGKIGAVRNEKRARRIGAAERIARIVQAGVDRGAAGIAQLGDEAPIFLFVGLGPMVVANLVKRGERRR